MKDMLASLPQYQEQREKVGYTNWLYLYDHSLTSVVLPASQHG